MTKRYSPKDIEPKWQKIWADSRIYEVAEDTGRQKIYASPMLPYPSGTGLHTGHVRNYSITDAVARFHRQRGYNTMSNIGWDSFGLPAENFAIKTGTPPAVSTAQNIAYFKEQLQRLGMSYDWSREFNTSDPSYYKWTQWLFTQLYSQGLAYQAEKPQWWCDQCKTVLADEQVIAGKCWRHDGPDDPLVTKRNLRQWFFKITEYAEEMLEATDALDWPEKIKTMQKNWIGRSAGAEIEFALANSGEQSIRVFTTRPDTIFGATFLVLAPEHELISTLTQESEKSKIESYVDEALRKDEVERQAGKEKTGVFTGSYAINPANGEQIPVWIADYVLPGYGTGAIMAVPAHDERDFEFALKYDLPIVPVIEPVSGEKQGDEVEKEAIVAIVRNPTDGKVLMLDWGPRMDRWGGHLFIGGGRDEGEDEIECAKREIAEETGYTNVEYTASTSFIVHSYYFSNVKNKNYYARMRGLLFDLVDNTQTEQNLDEGEKQKFSLKWVAASEADRLIDDNGHRYIYENLIKGEVYHGEGVMVNSSEFDGQSSSEARENIVKSLVEQGVAVEKTNYKIRDWLISRQRYWGAPVPIIYCPEHGPVAVPASHLPVELPEVSNYAPDGTNHSVLAGVEDWVNTTCPTCGGPAKRETDVLDGYVCSSWYLYRYTDAHNDKAAFDPEKVKYWFPLDFYFGGDHAVAHLMHIRFLQRAFIDGGVLAMNEREPVKRLVYNGYINAEDGNKMSKSKGNTVDPMDIINSGYGADALRLFELFIAPYDQDTSWNTNGVPGTHRFLSRIWTLVQEYLNEQAENGKPEAESTDILKTVHKTIQKVTDDLERLSFNTAVAAMMEAVNELYLIKAKAGFSSAGSWQFAFESLAQLLGPFAPHFAEEIWHDLGHTDSVHINHWPEWDDKYLARDTVIIVVQVNGKLRAQLELPTGIDEPGIIEAARSDERIKAHLNGEPKKTIYVPGKLVNFVV